MLISRLRYYLNSIFTLLAGVQNWPLLFAVFLGRASHPVIRLRSGLQFSVRTFMDVWIIKETCLDRDYEQASVELQDGWTVLDIGAGLGDFTLQAAKLHPHSTVYAYEPFPQSYALLETNLKLNGVSNVRLSPQAVSAASGRLKLYAIGQAVQHRAAAGGQAAPATALDVPCVTLDQAFADLALARCDFLKIDCEGAEYELLFGASDQTLAKIRHVCLEYHEGVTTYGRADLARFFEQKGFRVSVRPNPVHRSLGFLSAVNLAVKPESESRRQTL